MTLRVTVEFHEDETRLSLVSRLAVANGYSSLADFLSLTATNAKAIRDGDLRAVNKLSAWSGVEAHRLLKYAMLKTAPGAPWSLGQALMSNRMAVGYSHRYCPHCLVGDRDTGQGRHNTRPYARIEWLTRAYQNCLRHACPIIEVPSDLIGQLDFARFVEGHLPQIEKEAASNVSVDAMKVDEFIASRINGKRSNPFLDTLEAYVAVELCNYVGVFDRTNHSDHGSLSDPGISDRERGYDIVSKGPRGIEIAIAAAVKRNWPPAHELNSFFGNLRIWLLKNREKDTHSSLVAMFQDIAERHLPLGKTDLFLLPTSRRYLHTVRSVVSEYGLLEERVIQLAIDAGLMKPSNLVYSRIYLDAEKSDSVFSAARDTITSTEISSATGISLDQVRQVLDAGLIPLREVFDTEERPFRRVARADFECFRMKLMPPPASPDELEQLQSLSKAARRSFCTYAEIIALALDGKLSTLRRAHDQGVISGLVVDFKEVKIQAEAQRIVAAGSTGDVASVGGGQEPGSFLNRNQAHKILRNNPGSIGELIRHGFLQVRVAINHTTKRRGDYVCEQSLRAFVETYISLFDLAAKVGLHTRTLRKQLDKSGIAAIYEPTGTNSRYYRIEDVRELSL